MEASYYRHDISDEVWALLKPHLPGQRGQWGGIAQDNRRFINAVFWALRTGAPWRGIATRYAKTSDAFIAAVQIRCIALWAAIRV